jgi:hypothetical protein
MAAATPVTPVPAVSPAHLFGLEAIYLVLRRNRGTGLLPSRWQSSVCKGLWRQRCGLRAGSQGRGAGGKSNGEFQKVAAFHDISLFENASDAEESFVGVR